MCSRIIGIDLGTTNSCVAVMENGRPRIIPNAEGNRTTPSAFSVKDGEVFVGEVAARQSTTNSNTVLSVKSKVGEDVLFSLEGTEYTPQEISAAILTKLKMQAEVYLREKVSRAVIAVPAYFNDAQRQATRDAGRIAGLKVERIINEPTAAALAYGLDRDPDIQTILVYDFGGGTFDTSILKIDNGLIQVRSTAGSSNLGGDNLNEELVGHLLREYYRQYGEEIEPQIQTLDRFKEAAEKAKRELSFQESTLVTLPFIGMKERKPVHFEIEITRAAFERLVEPVIRKTLKPLRKALLDANMDMQDISNFIMVGGSTRVPLVTKLLQEEIGVDAKRLVDIDEVVALGAAIQAGVLEGLVRDVILVDVTSLSIGVETSGGNFTRVVPRNTSIPVRVSKTFTTSADDQTSVEFKIYQGEMNKASENKLLGTFSLNNILKDKAGVPQIIVSFSVNSSGILSAQARDKRTNRKQELIVSTESNLTEEQLVRMVAQAKNEERRLKDSIRKNELLNEAHQVTTQVTRDMSRYGFDGGLGLLVQTVNRYTYLDDVSNLKTDLQRLKDSHYNYLLVVEKQKTQENI